MPEALFSYHLNSEVEIINLLSVPHRKEKIEALRDEVSQLHFQNQVICLHINNI